MKPGSRAMVLWIAVLAASSAPAAHPGCDPHYFRCQVIGDTVRLEWDGLGCNVKAFLERDAGRIADVAWHDTSYSDRGVAPGRHVYRLRIDGPAFNEPSCTAEVPEGRGLRCALEGGAAVLRWDPLPEADEVARIEVFRDGESIAELGSRATSFEEVLPAGRHHYAVFADLIRLDPAPPLFIGGCWIPAPSPARFLRGDCNGDGSVLGSVSDPVFLLQFNFNGGSPPTCLAACDVNGDGEVQGQVTDAVFLLQHLFLGGPPPPEPFPACGPGPTIERLPCEQSACG